MSTPACPPPPVEPQSDINIPQITEPQGDKMSSSSLMEDPIQNNPSAHLRLMDKEN